MRSLRIGLAAGLFCGALASAEEGPAPVEEKSPFSDLSASLHGDVKTFFVAGVPYRWFGLPDEAAPLLDALGMTEEEALAYYGLSNDPFAQGILSGRLKAEATYRDALRLDVHWAIAVQNSQQGSIVPGMESGVGLGAPEAAKLTWMPDVGDGMALQHRFDRLVVTAKLPKVDVALGRQPISFGTGYFFTPLDLVNPFHPATIDSEYKPGVDALRVDGYAGISGKMTLAAAYAGVKPLLGEARRGEGDGPLLDDLVLAASGQGTVGVTDLIGFVGAVHGEPVLGLGTISAIGPVGVHAEATVTLPARGEDGEREDPFVRAVAGADWRPGSKTTLMAEGYLQTFGARYPCGYLGVLESERFARGEVWQMGQAYAALSVAQEVTPLVHANLAVVGNLLDPSALVVAGGSWSVADNADVAFGAYLGAGKRPDEVDFGLEFDPETMAPVLVPPTERAMARSVNGEFGLYPEVVYAQVRTYF